VRIWLARLTTATSLAFGIIGIATASSALAGDAVRLLGVAIHEAGLPEERADEIRDACGSAADVCIAQGIVDAIGPKAALVEVRHPDSDTIRLAATAPSITDLSFPAPDILRVRLDHFGRKAEWEVAEAVLAGGDNIQTIELDLRGNSGGDLDRMLRVAALFTGAVVNVLNLTFLTRQEAVSIAPPITIVEKHRLRVLIGSQTASSAEVLAALLRQHAGAQILGLRSRGKDWLQRLVAVNHDYRLALPVASIHVSGVRLAGGLVPDGPLPVDLDRKSE